MNRIKLLIFFVAFGLSNFFVHGQNIGNYVSNGSFEEYKGTNAKYWNSIDSAGQHYLGFVLTPPNDVPLCSYGYQWPKHGRNHFISLQYFPNSSGETRGYPKNRLKQNLQAGKEYCVKLYVNLSNQSTYGIDQIGVFFGDGSIDTITKCGNPIPYLTPQVKSPANYMLTDTLNWILISGSFIAKGTEKYMLIGNFRSDANTNAKLCNPTNLPFIASDNLFDAISVIEKNLLAYAGPDKLIYSGDSVFIGRQPDFAIDSGCVWFMLPNMTTPIDTISGLWVKPTVTSTYVVRQELDCSPLKWDTVIVTINTNLVSVDKLRDLSSSISLFPNPTSGNLNILLSGFTSGDIRSYSIINNVGQLVMKENIELTSNSVDILTSDLSPGLYQIRCDTRFGSVTKKFVKSTD